jgi:hypothetical protein
MALWVPTSLLIGLWHITALPTILKPFSLRFRLAEPPRARWATPSARR